MQYLIKTKLVKILVDTIYVKDTAGADKFLIKEKFGFFPKWDIFDMEGKKLLCIKKMAFNVFARYDVINTDNKTLAIIKRKFSPFVPKYKITNKIDENSAYELSGDAVSWNFSVKKNGSLICDIRKQTVSLTNNYDINVFDENDTLLCFACVLALGREHHKNKNKSKY